MKLPIFGRGAKSPLWRVVTAGAAAFTLAAGVAVSTGANVAGAAVPQAAGAAPAGMTTVQESSGDVTVFTTYPDMATCEAVYLTDCFEFTDGTVVGAFTPIALLAQQVNTLPAPAIAPFEQSSGQGLTAVCFTVPQMGSSDLVKDVYDGTTMRLALANTSCTNLDSNLAHGRVTDIINPESSHVITPLDPPSAADMTRQMEATCGDPADC
jgi:hypothetical protein